MKFYLTRDKSPGPQDYKLFSSKPVSCKNIGWRGVWRGAYWMMRSAVGDQLFRMSARVFHQLCPGQQLKPGEIVPIKSVDVKLFILGGSGGLIE